ncbi:MAG: sigma-70 family RNA polymerase sigma factor [Candidatus Riflebacteria bacterium]
MNDSEKKFEQQLIAETLTGNSSSFRPLIEKYWGLVYSIIKKYVKEPETVEDLAQESFLVAYSKLGQYRHEFNFSPWLARIAANKALEHLRREKRSPTTDFDLDLVHCQRFSPEQVFDQKVLFDECLEKLSAEMQIIFILRHGLEFSYEDIAHVLDLPTGTVKGLLFRIRSLLKQSLSKPSDSLVAEELCEGKAVK